MAVVTKRVDDWDGADLPDEGIKALTVKVEGHKEAFSLDLSAANTTKFLNWLEGKAGPLNPRGRTASSAPKATKSGPSAGDVRAWGAENGVTDSGKGRVGVDLKKAYNEAHADAPYA